MFPDYCVCGDIRSRFGSDTIGDHGHVVLTVVSLTQRTTINSYIILESNTKKINVY